MAGTYLIDYITDAQRLLHDATYRFWSQQDLIDYVNKARMLIVAETGCNRQLATMDIAAATDRAGATYSFSSIIVSPVQREVIDILDISLQYNTTTNYQLRYVPFSDAIRTNLWQYQNAGTPTHYTIHNRTVIIMQYPSIAYPASTFDCVVEPLELAVEVNGDNADLETDLINPYTECVGFYVAYLAKLQNQQRTDAEAFLTDYHKRKLQAIGTEFTRRLIGR